MLSLGKDAHLHFTENLKKILNHLNKLKTYEEMMGKRQTGMTEDDISILLLLFFYFLLFSFAMEDGNEEESNKENENVKDLIDRIKQRFCRKFLPPFVVVFDDVWSADAIKDYCELSSFNLVTSRNTNVMQHFTNVTQASSSQ